MSIVSLVSTHLCPFYFPTVITTVLPTMLGMMRVFFFYPEIKNNLACLDLTERKYPAAIARLEEALNLLAKIVLFDKRLEGTLKTNLDRAKTANSDVKPNQFFFRYLTINK